MTNQTDVLITGGTGFLGQALAKSFSQVGLRVVLAGRDQKRALEARIATDCQTVPMDVSNVWSVRDAVLELKPTAIIHAAAGKFVDLSETQPAECIETNVTGSLNVARVAMEYGVEQVIGISTDKAAPPVRNTYGLSKALMERMFSAMAGKSDTKFVSVRYGNVAWSTGSALPIWKGMLDRGEVVKSTGPQMRRYFFTVDDAVDLVWEAFNEPLAFDGAILTRNMKSAQISDLLDVWCALLGGRWEKTDGRPGEREDEFLVGEAEIAYASLHLPDHHIVIYPNRLATVPLLEPLSTATAQRMTKQEMVELIELGDVYAAH